MNNFSMDSKPPVLHRLALSLGKPFGLRWVGGRKLALVSQMERSHSLRGPGFFWIRPLFQRVRMVVSTAPENVTSHIEHVLTKDALMLDVTCVLEYRFDPRSLPDGESIRMVKRCPLPEERREIVENIAHRAMQDVMPRFYAEQVCRGGELFSTVEQQFMAALQERLNPFAIRLVARACFLKEIDLPAGLRERFVTSAQRLMNASDSSQYGNAQWQRLMESERVESLQNSRVTRHQVDNANASRQPAPAQFDEPLPPQIAGSAQVVPTDNQNTPSDATEAETLGQPPHPPHPRSRLGGS